MEYLLTYTDSGVTENGMNTGTGDDPTSPLYDDDFVVIKPICTRRPETTSHNR